ncbi:MAG: hypothetical protein V7756_06175 [Halopseudomonas sp.]|uniref:hypothetical protein n=1 Tax=Halopseudomonas sp. TaxID=2901191 RepID=UPI00300318B3
MQSPHVYVEQSEVIAALMPEVGDSVGTAEWWCISKPLAEALEQMEGQTVINDGYGCWWAIPYQGPNITPERTLCDLGLIEFVAH